MEPRTWGDLLAVEGEEEVIEVAGGDKDSGARLLSAVQDYKERKEERSKKRAKLTHNGGLREVKGEIRDVASFTLRQLMDELQNRHADEDGPIGQTRRPDSEEHFIELVGEFEGIHGARKRLFVRKAMRSIVGNIISYLEKSPNFWLLLGGTSGCGKSVVGSLVVILLAAKGHVVVYQQRGATMLILTETISENDKAMLDKILEMSGISPIPLSNSVWELNQSHIRFLNEFIRVPNFTFVQDLDDDANATILNHQGNGKRLIISSPDWKKLNLTLRN